MVPFKKMFGVPVSKGEILILLWFVLKMLFIFFKILLIFREGEGRERERERNINVWLPLTLPLLGTQPVTQKCALAGN